MEATNDPTELQVPEPTFTPEDERFAQYWIANATRHPNPVVREECRQVLAKAIHALRQITELAAPPPEPLVWAVPDLVVTTEDRSLAEGMPDRIWNPRFGKRSQIDFAAMIICRERLLREAYAQLNMRAQGEHDHFIQAVEARRVASLATRNLSVLKSAIGQKLGIRDAEIERRIHEEGGFPFFFGKELREMEAKGREEALKEAVAAVDSVGSTIQYVPQRSRTSICQRKSNYVDCRDAILRLLTSTEGDAS